MIMLRTCRCLELFDTLRMCERICHKYLCDNVFCNEKLYIIKSLSIELILSSIIRCKPNLYEMYHCIQSNKYKLWVNNDSISLLKVSAKK